MPPRHPPHFTGLFFDETAGDSAWVREQGVVILPPLHGGGRLALVGEVLPANPADPTSRGTATFQVSLAGIPLPTPTTPDTGPFRLEFDLPAAPSPGAQPLAIKLAGVTGANLLAWLGRVTGWRGLQPWRRQARNRRWRVRLIEIDGEVVFDFAVRLAPYSAAFARRHARLGLNIVGFLTADLGVGESARCMVRAADAAQLPSALVPLKLPCKNPQGDQTYAPRLQETNPHPVNVVHVDPPAARDVDHHHGPAFRRGKYNIGYFAWELPEFPDAWAPAFDYFDEVWCPSNFTRDAVALQSPVPVLTMPHAIAFPRPAPGPAALRRKFNLPPDPFLFLVLYDLNSYSARKNPAAALAAFRASGLAGTGAALVIKVQNADQNPADFADLQAAVRDLPGTILVSGTLPRAEIYELEAACDCFVSLHRSEGFGIALAECMYLGKPVIATDWSGPTEFITARTGCPVRCTPVTIERTHGPYRQGQQWAEPEVAHAAEWMRRLCADRALAAAIGAAGRDFVTHHLSPAAIGARYRRRLEVIAAW
jgi:glycosyltransferase involved in cell wall biosynthesis